MSSSHFKSPAAHRHPPGQAGLSRILQNNFLNTSLKIGTLTGTLLTLLGSITWTDIEKTLVLGSLGAAISFIVSCFLKKLIDYGKDSMGPTSKRPRKMQ